jgi:acetylglutamate kinase
LKEAIEKAKVLVEAMAWIRRFRNKTTVIKLGGSVMDDEEALRNILVDIVFMETVGMRPVVVHGGGKAISRAMDAAGIVPQFVHGRRYTDGSTLEIVEDVLATEVNEALVQRIQHLQGHAAAVNFKTHNVLRGRRLALVAAGGEEMDLGYVGEVTQVDGQYLSQLCQQGVIPVIPSMCIDEDGQKYNVNADDAATAVGVSLEADKLVFISDVNGVCLDKDDPTTLIHSLDRERARTLIQDGAIGAGMIPKVESCLRTLEKGVGKVHIIDGRLRHSLLLEVYTNSGVGTEIVL